MAEVREPIRVLDLVVAARFRFRESHGDSESAAREALRTLGVLHLSERRWPGLSGGERQRIALATLWAQEAPLLLLDEPANHLDPTHQIETYRWIAELVRQGRGVLCVTHDVDLIGWLADRDQPVRVVGIREGRIQFDHPWSAAEIQGALERLFDVPFERVEVGGHRRLLVSPRGASAASIPGERIDSDRLLSDGNENGEAG
jgi:iron complex transport system ATP-binding protein